MKRVYPCVLREEAGGGFQVTFPDVSGANTSGIDRQQALELAEDALVAALGAHYRVRKTIPLPSPVADGQERVTLRPVAAAKVALHIIIRERDVTGAELAARLGMSDAEIAKLLNPDASSPIDAIENAINALTRHETAPA